MLDEIIEHKRQEIEQLKADPYFEIIERGFKQRAAAGYPARDFAAAISHSMPGSNGQEIRIIAEVKKASPSKGVIREDFKPLAIAREYEAAGAAAVSVLTDEKYFQGSLEHLKLIKKDLILPVLRKDFIVDSYQIYESRDAGADAVLLIAAALPALGANGLQGLLNLTASLGMAALVEVHDEAELETALKSGARIIGINNRDLKTLQVDINTTIRLAPLVPDDRIIVSESGIKSHDDIVRLKEAGVAAFLIGEALMMEKDPGKKLKELRGRSD
jgi:indole-3-glycerol phosphate synthase